MGVLRDSMSIAAHVLSSFPHLLLPSTGVILGHHDLKKNQRRKGEK